MTEDRVIDLLCAFLRQQVAPQISLKVADDDDHYSGKLAHPAVYPVYHPMVDRGQPEDPKAQMAPALTVMPREGETPESGIEPGRLGVRVLVVAWDPGTRTEEDARVQHRRDESDAPWRAMCTLRELTKNALRSQPHIEGMRVRGPFRTGLYAQRDAMPDVHPYCFGWLDFTVEYGADNAYAAYVRALIE